MIDTNAIEAALAVVFPFKEPKGLVQTKARDAFVDRAIDLLSRIPADVTAGDLQDALHKVTR